MSERLSREDVAQLTQLLYERDADGILAFLVHHEVEPIVGLSMLARMCAQLMPVVTGDRLEDPGDMWIIEGHGSNPPAPTPAIQLVVACANGDESMIQAHLETIMSHDDAFPDAVGELIPLCADLLRLAVEKQQGGGSS